MKKLVLAGVLLLLAGSGQEVKKLPLDMKPMSTLLFPTPQKWKDAYGDTIGTRLAYNINVGMKDDRILRQAIIAVAQTVQKTHGNDPNEVIWRDKVDESIARLREETRKLDKWTHMTPMH